MKQSIAGGVVHEIPEDMKESLSLSPELHALWEGLTPIARNEWICWITSAKKADTRTSRINRMTESLSEGKRRPCCWPGCSHR